MLRVLVCSLFLLLPAARLLAAEPAPLPEDPALDRPVTLDAEDRITKLVAKMSESAGTPLAIDEHMGDMSLAVYVNEVPLRALMKTITALTTWEWKKGDDGTYRITGPLILPPLMDTQRLIGALAVACPPEVRPPVGVGPEKPEDEQWLPAPMGQVYSLLPKPIFDTIEEGGEVPFTKLPPPAQVLLRDFRREQARRELRRQLNPRWYVPIERLGLQVQAQVQTQTQGPVQGASWSLRIKREPPPPPAEGAPLPPPPPPGQEWQHSEYIPYQPLQAPYAGDPYSPGPTVSQAVLAIARKAGANLVTVSGYGQAAGEPRGETIEAMLDSVMPDYMKSASAQYRWEQEDGIYRIKYTGPSYEPLRSPAAERARKALEARLPAEYRQFLTMESGKRHYAMRGPWVKLWQALTEEQRKPGEPVPVPGLAEEQQKWLYIGLQAQMVSQTWSTLERTLGGDLLRCDASLDFGQQGYNYGDSLGFARSLQVKQRPEEGEKDKLPRTLVSGAVQEYPPLLRLLPMSDPALRKEGDLEVKDASIFTVAGKLSEILGSPVVTEDLPADVKLTAEFRKKPMRLLLHWVERRTGLQWSRREDVYVLVTPVPPELIAQEAKRALELLEKDLAGQGAAPQRGQWADMRKALTPEDEAALAGGRASFSQLSIGLQEAIRTHIAQQAQGQLGMVKGEMQLLERLGEARLRLKVQGQPGRPGPRNLVLEVPGGPSRSFYIPNDPQGGQWVR